MTDCAFRKSSSSDVSYELGKFPVCAFSTQMVFTILFAFFVDYSIDANGAHYTHGMDPIHGGIRPRENSIYMKYPVFSDVHVMAIAGFGFLVTFLKRYSYSGVGMNMFLAAILIQWSILCEGFFKLEDGKIMLGIDQILTADIAAIAGIVSWGAVLGKLSPLQTLFMAIVEMPFYACSKWLVIKIYKAIDPGASMTCHAFGAYFGLAVSFVIYKKDHKCNPKEKRSNNLDIYAMIGTIILWIYWPSFNAAFVVGDDRHRAIINTYLSLLASCVMTFTMTSMYDPISRIHMSDIQSATLAGGVAIGTASSAMFGPFTALIIGSIAAIICTSTSRYLTPILAKRCRIHDTCGVHNLHGIMGIYGGIVGVIMAALATEDMYGYGLYSLYPAMSPEAKSFEFLNIRAHLTYINPGINRTAGQQAVFQLVALVTTVAISLIGGLIAGLLIRLSIFEPPQGNNLYDDRAYWDIPEEEEDSEMTSESRRSSVDYNIRNPSINSKPSKTVIRLVDYGRQQLSGC